MQILRILKYNVHDIETKNAAINLALNVFI